MPDSQETKVLKDINRHLSNMSDMQKDAETISASDGVEMNKRVQDLLGNFQSMLDARLKRSVLVSDRAIFESFGELKDFNLEQANHQIGLLDDVIAELEMNNRFMAKSEQNKFLEEAERETDLNINRRTNDLLEDLVDKEEEPSKISEKDSRDSKSFFSGGMGGLFGGLFAGRSLAGLMGGIKAVGKKVFFPLLIAGAAAEFLRGWSEAGEDASTIEKFNSGISRTLSDLTFGLVSKEFFDNALQQIEGAVGSAWKNFTKQWDDLVNGRITAPDFFANIISGLTAGTLSPKQIKLIGQQIEDGMVDLVKTVTDAIVDGIVQPLMSSIGERIGLLFDDPVEFFRAEYEKIRAKQKKEAEETLAATKKLQAEGLSEQAALEQAIIDKTIKSQGFVGRIVGKSIAAPLLKKLGFGTETQEEAIEKRFTEIAEADLEAKKEANRKSRLAEDARKRLEFRYGVVKAAPRPLSDIGSEGLKARAELERAKAEKVQQQTGTANIVTNNAQNNIVPVDRQTENDDALNLNRTAGGLN